MWASIERTDESLLSILVDATARTLNRFECIANIRIYTLKFVCYISRKFVENSYSLSLLFWENTDDSMSFTRN